MPYPAASEPIDKVSINLFSKDVERMKEIYGRNWAEAVRRLVRTHIERMEGHE